MKRYSGFISGLAFVALFGAASAVVKADPNCYKRDGYNNETGYAVRSGCSGEGGACFVIACDSGSYNDDCFSWVECRPGGY